MTMVNLIDRKVGIWESPKKGFNYIFTCYFLGDWGWGGLDGPRKKDTNYQIENEKDITTNFTNIK